MRITIGNKDDSLIEQMKNRSLFGGFQNDSIIPDKLKSTLSNFPPIFKSYDICRNDIGDYIKKFRKTEFLID